MTRKYELIKEAHVASIHNPRVKANHIHGVVFTTHTQSKRREVGLHDKSYIFFSMHTMKEYGWLPTTNGKPDGPVDEHIVHSHTKLEKWLNDRVKERFFLIKSSIDYYIKQKNKEEAKAAASAAKDAGEGAKPEHH